MTENSPDIQAQIAERTAILDRLRAILINNLHVRREPDEIDPDTPIFATGLGLDSVDAVELLVALETEFGARLPDDHRTRAALRTLNTVIDTLIEMRAQGNTLPVMTARPGGNP